MDHALKFWDWRDGEKASQLVSVFVSVSSGAVFLLQCLRGRTPKLTFSGK